MMLSFVGWSVGTAMTRGPHQTLLERHHCRLKEQACQVRLFFQKKSCLRHGFDENINLTNCLSLRPATEDSRDSEVKAMLIIVERVIIAIQLCVFALREKFNLYVFKFRQEIFRADIFNRRRGFKYHDVSCSLGCV